MTSTSNATRRFVAVDDGVPESTLAGLERACLVRDVAYECIQARTYDWRTRRRLARGDLLYRPGVSLQATRVEQALYGPGVATFHRTEVSLYGDLPTSWLMLERAGLPVPTTVPLTTDDPEHLEALVGVVGGLPAVLKVSGYSGGLGVLRVDSLSALTSLVALLRARGLTPDLIRYVPDAVHWRVVVVGARAVASYPNPVDEGDFRTYASEDPADYRADADADMQRIAARAAETIGSELAGVDLLREADGTLWILEANFPCYHAQAEVVGGIDVSGPMLDHLLAKSSRLS
ncbi:MAG: hypothetical protein R3F05_10445 [Planctomycetota bacterium]